MNLPISKKKTNTSRLLAQLLYLLHLINKHKITGRFVHVQIKDEQLLKNHSVDYNSVIENLLNLKVIKKSDKEKKYFDSDYFFVNKNKLLIALFLCISISSFDNRTRTQMNKTNFSFDNIYDGIYKSLEEESESLFFSNNVYEQKIISFVYESLSLVVQHQQPFFIKHYQSQKTRLFKMFEIVNTKSKYTTLLEKEYGQVNSRNVGPTIGELRLELRKVLFITLFNNNQSLLKEKSHNPSEIKLLMDKYLDPLLQSFSLSSILPPSSSSTPPLYLYNCVVYIDTVISLLTMSFFSHKGVFSNKNKNKMPKNFYIMKDYLESLQGFGNTLFRIEKKVLGLLSEDDFKQVENEWEQSIIYYLNSCSVLFSKINDLILEINKKLPPYKFVFSPKVKLEDSLNGNYQELKITGRQYNELCDAKAHCADGDNSLSQRAIILKKMGYDYEGYDISSTIWTIAIALLDGVPNIGFNLKTELLKLGCKDINGNEIVDKRRFKPLNQITFFCLNSRHAFETYNSEKVRQEFEEKNYDKIEWLDLDEKTFNKLYYASMEYINNSKEFRDNIFFYESILELSVILRCQKEGIDVLNVYDCFFLKSKDLYPRLKTIIEEELKSMICFHQNIKNGKN